MKNYVLIVLIMFLSFTNSSASAECRGTSNFSGSVCQRACQNVFSLINLDVSLLSPRASISGLHIMGPKTTCCGRQATKPSENEKEAFSKENKQIVLRPAANIQETIASKDNEDGIIPIANKTELVAAEGKPIEIAPVDDEKKLQQPWENFQNKKHLFEMNIFRRFKVQVLSFT